MPVDANGMASGAVGDIVLPLQQQLAPQSTTTVRLAGNLDASAAAGTEHKVSVTAYDAAGNAYNFNVTLTSGGDGSWRWKAAGEGGVTLPDAQGALTFDAEGKVASMTYPGGTQSLSVTLKNGDTTTIALDVDASGEGSGLTARTGSTTIAVASQDGQQAGDLVNVRVDQSGIVQGIYSNGVTVPLARIALATFGNPDALMRAGQNVFVESAGSGPARVGGAGSTSTSVVIAGALEGSNVDVTAEFADMIVTQRGFQANARMITAADDMLSELINLKR
jgi:flagellar hook protein FlgE